MGTVSVLYLWATQIHAPARRGQKHEGLVAGVVSFGSGFGFGFGSGQAEDEQEDGVEFGISK